MAVTRISGRGPEGPKGATGPAGTVTWLKTKINSTNNVGLYTLTESITGQAAILSEQRNDISGEMPVLPYSFVSATSPVRGHHGNMFDAWMIPRMPVGSLFPDSTTRTFSSHNGLLLPWDPTKGLVKTR